ncbi:MAG: ABC transporter substrate-binding protein [Clostridiales bacterium]|nr:ABC transporter substrate-binding protein [Clostridiales bacterium]
MTHNKTIAMLMALTVLSGAAAACGDAAGNGTVNDQTIPEGTNDISETEEETKAVIPDNLPDTDLGGDTFRIYCSGPDMEKFFFSDATDGEVVNDAVYQSVQNVEERFNVDVRTSYSPSTDDGALNTAINQTILAGDDAFDVAENHDTLSGDSSLKGMYRNLYDLPYLDFSQPWYPTNAIDSLTLYGKLFLYSSAMSYKGLHQTRILYMNKSLLNDYGIESPYKNVFDGTWTLDRLIDITRGAYQDLNSSQNVDENDFFGFTVHQWFDGWMESFGLNAMQKDDDEGLVIGIAGERTADIVEKMYGWVFDGNDVWIAKKKSSDQFSESDIFSNSRSLITYGEISTSYVTYRNTAVDYGMLPFPKYDENQPDYISFYTDRFFIVPNTSTNLEKTGLMLEAMSAEGYRVIYPAYYEIALKVKYTQDDESVRILDIINQSRLMSFTYVYDNSSLKSIFNNMFNASKPNSDFASFLAKNEKSAQKRIDTVKAAFENS